MVSPSTKSLINGNNTGIVSVPEPEEGDVTDEKEAVFADEDSPMVSVPSAEATGGEPRKVAPKTDVFELRLQPRLGDFGTGHSYGSSRFETWKNREEMQGDAYPELLREDDGLYAEFDENMKAFYFGEHLSNFEHARWNHWEEFIHPEYTGSRDASLAKKNKGLTLQDCLDDFTKEEKLGEDDLWYCPRCKKHQQATKKFDLWKAPDVLVVHLKRFSNSRAMRDKIDTFVDFPIEGLDLTEMVGEKLLAKKLLAKGEDVEALGLSASEEPLIYDLFGVDEHMGGLGGGHYRAYALNHQTDQWYHFDDSYVKTTSSSDAVVSAIVSIGLFH